jgi:hypothetical protein
MTFVHLGGAHLALSALIHYRHGFNWFDRRGTEGVGFIRALRTLLTNNLPKILPDLTCIIRTRFQELHAGHPVINGNSAQIS